MLYYIILYHKIIYYIYILLYYIHTQTQGCTCRHFHTWHIWTATFLQKMEK